MKPLFDGAEWDFPTIKRTWEAIDKIAKEKFKLEYYPVQIEMISSEQMLDAYSSHAMPIFYNHWSFGKSFLRNFEGYKKGRQGLAYEVVINTDPCIAYLMEDNTMTMQALVLAHASAGHNSFFYNNYMFKDWTDAKFIVPYLKYAKEYIAKAEQKLGQEVVEYILDACHALQYHGVFKYKRKPMKEAEAQLQQENRLKYEEETFNDLWRTIPKLKGAETVTSLLQELRLLAFEGSSTTSKLPEENLLYFIEKNSETLEEEAKEIIRIVRNIAQYFYPQMQTKLMNEGWASFIHYEIMTELEKNGQITTGSYLEFLRSHSGVVAQPAFDSPYFSGINVYALGFSMFRDLKRLIIDPTEEDKYWFPEIAGKKDWINILQEIAYNFRDESFVLQYLSPKVIRDMQLFCFSDIEGDSYYRITEVATDDDIEDLRSRLSDQYNIGLQIPNIEIVDYDQFDTRALTLRHTRWNGIPLDEKQAKKVGDYIELLWGYEVKMVDGQ